MKFTKFQKKLIELIEKTSSPGKHSARNSINHINKAWTLKKIDPEMSVFRAITAEEEAVTAVFHSLKRRNYKGAKNINHRNHIHKMAMTPFIWGISNLFREINQLYKLYPQIVIDIKKPFPNLMLRVMIDNGVSEPFYAYPQPPLNLSIKENDSIYDFSDEFKKIADIKNAKSIKDYIKENANIRNKLLYASEKGFPKINSPVEKYIKKRHQLFLFILLYSY